MDKQIIIALGREFGSAGHEIAVHLAELMKINLYDRSMLDKIADNLDVKVEVFDKYDEKPKNLFLSRRVKNYSNSMEEILTELQFDFIKEKAESGESFVIVGRCADIILKDNKNLIRIFITGDQDSKLERVMDIYKLDKKDALLKMKRHDKKRKQYHNSHGDSKWGDSRFYDICMNSSGLSTEEAAEILKTYVTAKLKSE